jgi:hypothetical protein
MLCLLMLSIKLSVALQQHCEMSDDSLGHTLVVIVAVVSFLQSHSTHQLNLNVKCLFVNHGSAPALSADSACKD